MNNINRNFLRMDKELFKEKILISENYILEHFKKTFPVCDLEDHQIIINVLLQLLAIFTAQYSDQDEKMFNEQWKQIMILGEGIGIEFIKKRKEVS